MREQTEHRIGRPRDPEIRSKVLLAAQRVYTRVGSAGFTFEAIAREAGVGKPAIYRRWGSTDELMSDILSSHALVPLNSEREDIDGVLWEIAMASLRTAHSEQGAFILRVSSERDMQPGLFDHYFERLRRVIHYENRALMVAAIDRGELSTDCDPDVLIQTVTGAVLVGALLGLNVSPSVDAEAAEDYCRRVVDQILRGAAPSNPLGL